MSELVESAATARAALPTGGAAALRRQLINIYVLASVAAVAVVLGVVAFGLDLSARQWIIFLVPVPVMMLSYILIDVYLIIRHFRPLAAALEHLEEPAQPVDSNLVAASGLK